MAVIKENISKSKPKKGICVFLAVIYTAVLIYVVMLKNSGTIVTDGFDEKGKQYDQTGADIHRNDGSFP